MCDVKSEARRYRRLKPERDAGKLRRGKGEPVKRLACFSTVLCLLVLLTFVTVAGAQQPEASSEEVVVSIRDNYFDPADIVVAPGTTVRWVNEGKNPHNVTADNGLFDSGTLYPGDSFWVTLMGRGRLPTTARPTCWAASP
jgi:plastocyanin